MKQKTQMLNSCAVTVLLICTFVFTYVKSQFSHDVAQFKVDICYSQERKKQSVTQKNLSGVIVV